MKAILVIDVPVSESQEIDEYGMVADLRVRPITLTNNECLFYELKEVDIKPMPEEKQLSLLPNDIRDYQYTFNKGFNACIDEILGETK